MAEERTIVESGKYHKIYSDGTILLSDLRISYPHLDKKWAKKTTDTPAYSAVGLLEKEKHAEAIKAVNDFCTGMLKQHNKGAKIKADLMFIRDGDLAAKPEYEDHWSINAREPDNRPVVLNPDKSEMEQEDIKPTIKAGHYIDMLIEPWWMDNDWGKRVNASLRAVRYRREGEALAQGGLDKGDAISSFDDDEDGGFGGGDADDENGGL